MIVRSFPACRIIVVYRLREKKYAQIYYLVTKKLPVTVGFRGLRVVKRGGAKITEAFLKPEICDSEKGYCHHVCVIGYASLHGERKGRNEKNK